MLSKIIMMAAAPAVELLPPGIYIPIDTSYTIIVIFARTLTCIARTSQVFFCIRFFSLYFASRQSIMYSLLLVFSHVTLTMRALSLPVCKIRSASVAFECSLHNSD